MVKKLPKESSVSFILRYFLLIVLSMRNFWIFYGIFTPLTVYGSYFLMNLFFRATLSGNLIMLGDSAQLEIIDACVAGAAYYLLAVLNLSTPRINLNKRVLMTITSFSILLALNILRIFFLGVLLYYNYAHFEAIHKFFWYFLSIIFVVAIWFFLVKSFNIKEIPVYSDLKFLYKKSVFAKK